MASLTLHNNDDHVHRKQTLFLTALSLVEATVVAHSISLHTLTMVRLLHQCFTALEEYSKIYKNKRTHWIYFSQFAVRECFILK